MAVFTASANVRGGAIDLTLSWTDPPDQAASLRVVRRRWGYPTSPDDGLVLLDVADAFAAPATPWARIDRTRFLLLNDRAEGGILQGELARYYAGDADSEPRQVAVGIYDATADAFARVVITAVTRVTTVPATVPGYGAATAVTIYTMPAAGPEAPAGVLVVATQNLSAGAVTTIEDYTQLVAGVDAPPVVTTATLDAPDLLQWTPVAQAIANATMATPIAITTANAHWLASGARVAIAGVAGNTAANGSWQVLVTGPTTFTLTGSTGNAAYAGGGTVVPATVGAPIVRREDQTTASTIRGSAPLSVSFVTTLVGATGPVPISKVEFTDAPSPDTGDIGRAVTIADRAPPTRTAQGFDPGLVPGAAYYYAAFEDLGSGLAAGSMWTATAVATGRYGFAEELFARLPAVHRYYDDPASGQQGSWQLRSFLDVLGPGLDQARSLGEGLANLHDMFEVRAEFLPRLARLIGWEPDQTLPTTRQRNDIAFAPEVYATVGTVPNIRALVNRATGWGCQVKEFVHNVFLTNGVEPVRLWEIWEADAPTGAFDAAAPVLPKANTRAANDSIDAHPAVVADPGGGAPWLFWHSNRPIAAGAASQRRIWMMRADGSNTPVVVVDDDASLGAQRPAAVADVIAGSNVIRLFWSALRDGRPNLWTRTLTQTVSGWTLGQAEQLTTHKAGDDFPAAVRAGGKIWLFWQSSRRGPTDIWAMTLTAGVWSAPQRITGGQGATGPASRDQMPSAVIDGTGTLTLFWSADLGDRSRLYVSRFDTVTHRWSPRQAIPVPPVPPTFRDEAPAAVVSAGSLWLFWHSDRDGIPRVYAAQQTGVTWGAPFAVTIGRSVEKFPAPFIGAGGLRLFLATQRGGEPYRSRTVNMSDLGAIKKNQVDDRWHYTYSTAGTPMAFYARDAVGLYLTPTATGSSADHESERDRVQALVEPFRPVPARFVWFLDPPVDVENIYSQLADIGESYVDQFPFVEVLGDVGETSAIAVPWVVLQTNTPGEVTADAADLSTLNNRVFFPPAT
jgi:hypothetical protein